MDIPIKLQQQLNDALSGVNQSGEPIHRAKRAGELKVYLQRVIDDLEQVRRRAIAEAINWPGESMATVAEKLNLSKSAIAKLATPDIREVISNDLRARLAKGYNPPPLRPLSSSK
jgi:radical SAM superfamily enzyme with C-terminal helix-hairpin-helix motif